MKLLHGLEGKREQQNPEQGTTTSDASEMKAKLLIVSFPRKFLLQL